MLTTHRAQGSNDQKLRKNRRIRKRRDFLRVQRSGIRVQGNLVVLIAKRLFKPSQGRVGFTVAKTVGRAHDRNLVKRRLRHVVRENLSLIASCDVVILALPGAALVSFEVLKNDLLCTFEILLKKLFAPNPNRSRSLKPSLNPESKS